MLHASLALSQRLQPNWPKHHRKTLKWNSTFFFRILVDNCVFVFWLKMYMPKLPNWYINSLQIVSNFFWIFGCFSFRRSDNPSPVSSNGHSLIVFVILAIRRSRNSWKSDGRYFSYSITFSVGHVECIKTSWNESPCAVLIVARNLASKFCKSLRTLPGLIDGAVSIPVNPITRGCNWSGYSLNLAISNTIGWSFCALWHSSKIMRLKSVIFM